MLWESDSKEWVGVETVTSLAVSTTSAAVSSISEAGLFRDDFRWTMSKFSLVAFRPVAVWSNAQPLLSLRSDSHSRESPVAHFAHKDRAIFSCLSSRPNQTEPIIRVPADYAQVRDFIAFIYFR